MFFGQLYRVFKNTLIRKNTNKNLKTMAVVLTCNTEHTVVQCCIMFSLSFVCAVLETALYVAHVVELFLENFVIIGYCFFYSTFYPLLRHASIKMTSVATIHYSKVNYVGTCDDFLRLPDVLVASHP